MSTAGPESTALLAALNRQRQHVLGILDGLDEEALHRPVLPTGWNCLGLVQHLAIDVERFWFRSVVTGQLEFPADAPSGWLVAPGTRPEEVLACYRHEIELANATIGDTALDASPVNWPAYWPDWSYPDFRSVLLHVITETACHAGHLDAARELIDGRTWLVLTD